MLLFIHDFILFGFLATEKQPENAMKSKTIQRERVILPLPHINTEIFYVHLENKFSLHKRLIPDYEVQLCLFEYRSL